MTYAAGGPAVSHSHGQPNGQYQHSHSGGDRTHKGGDLHGPNDTYLGYWKAPLDGAETWAFIRPSGILADTDVPAHTVDAVVAKPEKRDGRIGDPRFHAVLKEMADTHDRKQQDYGSDVDPFANLNATAQFGISPWVGAYIRINDKLTRIKSFIARGTLANESLEDSLVDIATYAAIAVALYREEVKQNKLEAEKYTHPESFNEAALGGYYT
jgi:hypothetical protein